MQVAYWTYKLDIVGPVHLLFDHMESWTNFWCIRCFLKLLLKIQLRSQGFSLRPYLWRRKALRTRLFKVN